MGLENCITSYSLPIFRPAGAYPECKKSLRIDFEGLFIFEKEIGKFVYTSLKKLSKMSKIIKFYHMD